MVPHFFAAEKQQYITVRLIMHMQGRLVDAANSEPVEVVAGEVRLGKELGDFQRLLKNWFYTCYTAGTCILFVVQLLLWVILQFCWDERRRRTLLEEEEPTCDLDMEGSHIGGGEQQNDGENMDFGQWEDLPRESSSSAQESHQQDQENDVSHSADSSNIAATPTTAGPAEHDSPLEESQTESLLDECLSPPTPPLLPEQSEDALAEEGGD
jgi:hypothetical protein